MPFDQHEAQLPIGAGAAEVRCFSDSSSVPVADVDRAKACYVDQVGFRIEQDVQVDEGHRFVELVPPATRRQRLARARAATRWLSSRGIAPTRQGSPAPVGEAAGLKGPLVPITSGHATTRPG